MAWPDDDAGSAHKAAPPPRRAHVPRPHRPLRPERAPQKVVAPTPKAKPPQKAHSKEIVKAKAKAQSQPAAAAAKSDGDDGDDADVEEVENVEATDVSAGQPPKDGASNGEQDTHWTFNKVMGHMHAAMVHLPIAWLFAWAGCEALALLWTHPFLQMAGLPVGLMTVLSFAPAVLSGLLRLDELTQGSSGYDVGPAMLHRNLNFAAWGMVVLGLIFRLLNCHLRRGLPRAAYVGLVLVAFGIVGYSAHLGGIMVYGEEFFPF